MNEVSEHRQCEGKNMAKGHILREEEESKVTCKVQTDCGAKIQKWICLKTNERPFHILEQGSTFFSFI